MRILRVLIMMLILCVGCVQNEVFTDSKKVEGREFNKRVKNIVLTLSEEETTTGNEKNTEIELNERFEELILTRSEKRRIMDVVKSDIKIDFNNEKCSFFTVVYIPESGKVEGYFFLVDDDDNIVYFFPEQANSWFYYLDTKEILSRDIDGDGFDDIVIISHLARGHGEYPMTPVAFVEVYYRTENGFYCWDSDSALDLELKLTDIEREDMDKVVEYLLEMQKLR